MRLFAINWREFKIWSIMLSVALKVNEIALTLDANSFLNQTDYRLNLQNGREMDE